MIRQGSGKIANMAKVMRNQNKTKDVSVEQVIMKNQYLQSMDTMSGGEGNFSKFEISKESS